MGSIDRADWHYGGDFPEGLSEENGGTHIGMYLNWIIANDLISNLHQSESINGVTRVKRRIITGRDFLFDYCDEKFLENDLSEEGLLFTKEYYQDPNDPEGGFGKYFEDYEEVLGSNYDSLYKVPNTWENYDLISKKIDSAFLDWKNKKNRKFWQFWK